MLELGTSHNRWFVERKFLQMAGPNIEDALAERIATEIDVLNVDFNTQFGHLSRSVSATIDQIHPLLRRLLI